jgi:hypothetical protein
MTESIPSLIGQIAVIAITAKAIHWLRTANGGSLPRSDPDGRNVYEIKWQWKAVGFTTAIFGCVLAVWRSHDFHSMRDWVSIIFFPALALSGLWLATGLVTTDSMGIKKRMLWRSRSLRWDQITEVRLLSKDIGAIDLRAGRRKLIVESRFVGFRHLLDEITNRTNLQPTGSLPLWVK